MAETLSSRMVHIGKDHGVVLINQGELEPDGPVEFIVTIQHYDSDRIERLLKIHTTLAIADGLSGASDAAMWAAWNDVYDVATQGDPMTGPAAWLVVKDWLCETLETLRNEQAAFEDSKQATRVITLLWSELLPSYLDYHRDLLIHQEPEVVSAIQVISY